MPAPARAPVVLAFLVLMSLAGAHPAAATDSLSPQEPWETDVPTAGPMRPDGPLVPAVGTLFGAYVDPDARWTGDADARAEVTAFESKLGRTLHVNHHYYAWTDTFPSALEPWDVANDRIPMITWEPWGTRLTDISAGKHDARIRARARGVAALGSPVFLRWGHEMNGDWYPWSGSSNAKEPDRYVAAWRRVHDLFEAEGATNAVWVWSPNADDVPSATWNHFSRYYPGDDYVDWVGIDGYNWGTTRSWSSWRSFRSIVSRIYKAYADRKPIMVAETSSAEQGGSKAAWIADARRAITEDLPSIAALVWFHVNKETDWRADSSAAAWSAYREMGADPRFGALPGTLSGLSQT